MSRVFTMSDSCILPSSMTASSLNDLSLLSSSVTQLDFLLWLLITHINWLFFLFIARLIFLNVLFILLPCVPNKPWMCFLLKFTTLETTFRSSAYTVLFPHLWQLFFLSFGFFFRSALQEWHFLLDTPPLRKKIRKRTGESPLPWRTPLQELLFSPLDTPILTCCVLIAK